MDSIVPAVFATGAEFVKWPAWVVYHVSVVGLSHENLPRKENCSVVDQPGHACTRSQDAHLPEHCQCLDATTIATTFVSTPTISEFFRIQRGVDFRIRQSNVAADSSPRNFGIPTVAPAPSLDQCWKGFSGCADVSSTGDSKLPLEPVDQQIV